MSQKLKLDMEDVTLGDMEAFETATGEDFMKAVTPRPVIDPVTNRPTPDPDDPRGRPLMEVQPTTKMFLGLVYIAMRKENPNVTIEEVRAMRLSDIDLDMGDDADPTVSAVESESGEPA